MKLEWFGQSAFRVTGERDRVVIDPIGDVSGLRERGLRFEYPPITGVEAESS